MPFAVELDIFAFSGYPHIYIYPSDGFLSEPLSLLSNQILGLLLPPSDENVIIVGTLFAQLFFPLRQIYSVQNELHFFFISFRGGKRGLFKCAPVGRAFREFQIFEWS